MKSGKAAGSPHTVIEMIKAPRDEMNTAIIYLVQ